MRVMNVVGGRIMPQYSVNWDVWRYLLGNRREKKIRSDSRRRNFGRKGLRSVVKRKASKVDKHKKLSSIEEKKMMEKCEERNERENPQTQIVYCVCFRSHFSLSTSISLRFFTIYNSITVSNMNEFEFEFEAWTHIDLLSSSGEGMEKGFLSFHINFLSFSSKIQTSQTQKELPPFPLRKVKCKKNSESLLFWYLSSFGFLTTMSKSRRNPSFVIRLILNWEERKYIKNALPRSRTYVCTLYNLCRLQLKVFPIWRRYGIISVSRTVIFNYYILLSWTDNWI